MKKGFLDQHLMLRLMKIEEKQLIFFDELGSSGMNKTLNIN